MTLASIMLNLYKEMKHASLTTIVVAVSSSAADTPTPQTNIVMLH